MEEAFFTNTIRDAELLRCSRAASRDRRKKPSSHHSEHSCGFGVDEIASRC
jgi:hypothetical protein